MRADVVIIGAGALGCAIALELSRKGYATLNLDKRGAAGHGSTGSSSAIVRTHYSTPEGVAMAYEGYFYWRRWADYVDLLHTEAARFVGSGAILLKSEAWAWNRCRALFDAIGIAYEEWDRATLAARMPIFDLHAFGPARRPEDAAFWDPARRLLEGAVFTPEAGYVPDPQLATENLKRAAEVAGARFRFKREVTGVLSHRGRVAGVELAGGNRIEAPVVVNAAGPHSARVNRLAGVEEGMRIRTRPLRQEVHFVPAPLDFDFEKHGCYVFDSDTGVYFRPEAGNTILVGSEDPPCDPRGWIDDADRFEREVSEAQWRAQVYRLARRIPTLPIPASPRGLVDLYDVTDDWIPIYDRSDLPGFYLAIGTSGNQFKNAGVVGHAMAELIDACENGRDHDAEPVRVCCRYIRRTLDLGFYSRRRDPCAESSFSVNG